MTGKPTMVSQQAAKEAAHWLVKMQSGEADADALARWRAADQAHEAAWQRAAMLMNKFGLAKGSVGAVGAHALRNARRTRRRSAIQCLTVAFVVTPAAFVTWRSVPWSSVTADIATAVGERRSVELPDGTRIQLDTDSAVDIAFSALERRVVLRQGAIWIETSVVPDIRPFLVQTSQGLLKALGTRFSVRQFDANSESDRFVLLGVSQGAVALSPALGLPSVLQAGKQARMLSTGTVDVDKLSPQTEGWIHGVFYADGISLAEFAAEMSRYRPGRVRCDPAVAHLRVSGAFQLVDTDAALRVLEASLPVQIKTRTRFWVLIGPA